MAVTAAIVGVTGVAAFLVVRISAGTSRAAAPATRLAREAAGEAHGTAA
jgi:hypothetical protein